MKNEGGIRIGRVVKMDLVRAGGILFGFIRRLWSWLFFIFYSFLISLFLSLGLRLRLRLVFEY